ncbi:Hemerythrin domain-containing protein [Pseudozyma hubeiensis]|nr:Hemerythrin domain-containing protein [Pseudozyma hubeiensis]
MTGKKNLIDEIKVDHDNIRDLHKRFNDAHKSGDQDLCEAIVNTIIHEAAVHSDAEELSIYKLMERFNMASAAKKDRDDHQQVKQAMSELDTHQISGGGLDVFAQKVDKACRLFIEHAEEEENDQLPRLCKELSADEHSKAVDDFLSARKMAPTRPHPSAPQSGGMTQKLAGGMSKPLDKAVEMGRKLVDVKHHHSDETAQAA